MERNLYETNAKILVLSLFQYALLIPVMQFIAPGLLVAATNFLLVCRMFRKNFPLSELSSKPILFIMAVLILLLIKSVTGETSSLVSAVFLSIALPVMLMYIFPFDYSVFIRTGYKLAIINFAIICTYPMYSGVYMRFGYAMLPTVVFIYIAIMYLNTEQDRIGYRIFNILLLAAAFAEMLIWGARGASASFILFVIVERIAVKRKHPVLWSVFLCLMGYIVVHSIDILINVINLINDYGIRSYALAKFKMQLTQGLMAAASGRDIIYAEYIAQAKEHLIFGGSINLHLGDASVEYAHNMFIQMLADFGLTGLCVFVVFLIVVLYKIWDKKQLLEARIILAALFSISVGRLLFSSVIWRRPEFWMLVCFFLTMKDYRNINEKSSKRTATVLP